MERLSPRWWPEVLLLAACMTGAATGWLQCGGTEDLTPKDEPRPYEVIGNEDCAVFPDLYLRFRNIAVGPGAHTLRLEASTYSDQPDSAYRSRFVCVLLGAGADTSARQDWFFTLNGVGDEKTVTFTSNSTVHIGYIGTVPLGNHGSSVVSIDAQQFEIFAESHSVIADDLSERFIEIDYDSSGAGNYEVTLDASNFAPRTGLVAPLVVVYFPDPVESARDRFITSLNGIGDKVTVHLEPDARIYAGFVDDLAIDNSGGAEVTVAFRGAP
jgi:hypothetical protein